MNGKKLNKFGLKISENDFKFCRHTLLGQNRMRRYKVNNIKEYIKAKNLFSLPMDVHIKNIGKKNGFDIWLVDGAKIRQFIDIDFVIGGNGMRYLYVPMNEIWVDADSKHDIEPTVFHEITEFNLMKRGLCYDTAHGLASIAELSFRQNNGRHFMK